MTRWARGKVNKEHDATQWNEYTKNKPERGDKLRKVKKSEEVVPDWLEKRRDARRKRRQKAKPCFHCRQGGHKLTDCPQRKQESEIAGGDICFKCGLKDHSVHECTAKVEPGEYPFATCFICKQTGHLSSKCPDNPRGLYPDGGGCKFCGSVEHYRRDCPERETNEHKDSKPRKHSLKLMTTKESVDAIDHSDDDDSETKEILEEKKKKKKSKHKTVKF